jgi:hypothetical protein
MTFNWLYRLGDWNPQFFREFKGRLHPKTLYLTVTVSLMAQLVLLLYFWQFLPVTGTRSNRYCTGSKISDDSLIYRSYDEGLPECIKAMGGNLLVNWPLWWSEIVQALNWALPLVLLSAGVYMLISDLAKEERRRTLNFIRLSPQTSQSILIGKILGVPLVPYLAVALALPLQLMAAMGAAVPAKEVLSLYLLTIAAAGFFYTGSLLLVSLGVFQGWVGAIIVWLSYSLFFMFSSNWSIHYFFGLGEWYFLSLNNHLSLALGLALLTFGLSTFWIWQAVNRRFRNPNVTLLSKRQSYSMTACFELWLLGFVYHNLDSWDSSFIEFVLIAIVNLLWFLVLMVALMPQRQRLLDWARYRREQAHTAKQFVNRSVLRDLIWGEKSPTVLAIGVNLLITAGIFSLWIFSWREQYEQIEAFTIILLGSLFVLTCAVTAHSELLMKSFKGTSLAVSFAWIFLFSVSAFVIISEQITAGMVFLSFLEHLSVLSLLTVRLTRQIRRVGASESKSLLIGSNGV